MSIIKNPTQKQIKQVIQQLSEGEIIVCPTDTIYGIAANINSDDAIRKVYDLKKRSYDKPLSIIVHEINNLKDVAYVNDQIMEIAQRLLPGPYTLILNKKNTVSNFITASKPSVGVRIPDNEITYALTKKFPITTTSANLSHMPTCDNIKDIKKQLQNDKITYLDTGIVVDNTPSTIIDMTGKYPKIIRKAKTDNNIEDILKIKILGDN